MIKLTTNQVLLLHSNLLSEFRGLEGVHDLSLLDSAINAPFQTFNCQDVYPSIQQKASRLCYGLVKNHPFIDGNKKGERLVKLTSHIILIQNYDFFRRFASQKSSSCSMCYS